MRHIALALAFCLAAAAAPAVESARLNFVKGVYSLAVPADAYIDVDAEDATLTVAQGPEPTAPRVIVAVPNPRMAARLDDYARMAANAFIGALGGGSIVEDKGERSEHGVIFRASSTTPFVGAVHTIRSGNYAVLTIFLTRDADYARSHEWAALILDSLRVDGRALEQQTAFVGARADNLLRDFARYQGGAPSIPPHGGAGWNAPDLDDVSQGQRRQQGGGLINNPFSGLTR